MAKKGTSPSNKGKNKKTGLSYNDIKDIYVTGKYTLKQLAGEFGIEESTLNVQSATYGWTKERNAYREKYKNEVRKKLKGNVIEEEIKINEKHYSIWNKIYSIIDDVLENKEVELTYEDGAFKLNKIETIANIMVQTQNGQRLAAGLIEATKLREIQVNEKRLELEVNKANPSDLIEQDRTFIDALQNTGEEIWNDEDIDLPEAVDMNEEDK